MGKTAICLQMIEILNTGRKYQISELAELLETKDRNIIEYKKELEDAGYYITSGSGKYGGYRLDKTCVFPALKLERDEKRAIKESYEYLISRSDFLNKASYNQAMGKIISSFSNDFLTEPLMVVDKESSIFDSKRLEYDYNTIKEAIDKTNIITFNYINNSNVVIAKEVEPYALYIYNSNWFLLGYCRTLKDYRCYKLIRMSDVINTNKRFSKDIRFNISQYFDELGNKRNDEWYHVKLKLKGYPIVKLQEKTIGKNQELSYISNQEAILECDMQYKYNIISFVLGLGCSCEVISPAWLKEEIVNEMRRILSIYKIG